MSRCFIIASISLMLVAAPGFAAPISPDREPAEDNSVEAEQASFEIHEEFSVNLFADESLGIANPIAIQWDDRGRLWVLCTLAYAQLKPGELPDDKLFILEDTDGDGRADKSILFADGLDMPTGFALGHGGVWMGEGPDLVFLKDTDGDDKADQKKVVLTGFGTGDTHQNISNFIFDSGGFLYFCQGLHAFSHVETPWGVSRGDRAGFWRFDPRTTRLDPFCFPGMTSANPCGIALDRWGALFLKSNGPHLGFATPGLIPTTHVRELMQYAQIGATPGKSMGVDIVETAHFPDWFQNHAVIAGYFARQVTALPLVEEAAGFKVVEPIRILKAGHQSFRPVDIRMGPDGAIYVADWFNPVINHYQVSLRHPHRDTDHGRIWRITAKDRPPVEHRGLPERSADKFFDQLRSGERWVRDTARRELAGSDPNEFGNKLIQWTVGLDPDQPLDALALVEAAGILESQGMVLPEMLDRLQQSAVPHARAVVARMIARSAEPIPDGSERLAKLLRDPHPRPRLEAVVACANLPQAESLPLALIALESETDKNIDYALRQAVQALSDHWVPALESGKLMIDDPVKLTFVLETYGGGVAASLARGSLESADLPDEIRNRFLGILGRNGSAEDLRSILDRPHENAALLNLLIQSWQTRKVKPASPFQSRLGELLDSKIPSVRVAAVQLAGLWNAAELEGSVERLALDSATPAAIRSPALISLASLKGKAAAPELTAVARSAESSDVIRRAAIDGLSRIDINAAVTVVSEQVRVAGPEDDLLPLLNPILSKSAGPPALSEALSKIELEPESARQIAGALARLGRSDLELTQLLSQTLGEQAGAPDYDGERVAAIVAAVQSGEADPENGRKIYQLPQLTCIACHQIGKVGGILGPPLDAVGAGLPLDQIVESVIWPARQLKEGYFATAITTVDGQVHTGYIDREDKRTGVLWLRDSATREIRPVSLHQVLKREAVGTLMPPGLTNSLKPAELRDLIAYLASLKG